MNKISIKYLIIIFLLGIILSILFSKVEFFYLNEDNNEETLEHQPYLCDESLEGGYKGCQDKTESGKRCLNWTEQKPHMLITPETHTNSGLGNHNYCRNPDGQSSLWCYTDNSKENCKPVDHTVEKVFPENSRQYKYYMTIKDKINSNEIKTPGGLKGLRDIVKIPIRYDWECYSHRYKDLRELSEEDYKESKVKDHWNLIGEKNDRIYGCQQFDVTNENYWNNQLKDDINTKFKELESANVDKDKYINTDGSRPLIEDSYRVHGNNNQPFYYHQAKLTCDAMGGHLPIIKNYKQHYYFVNKANAEGLDDGIWLDARKSSSTGNQFKWSDDTNINVKQGDDGPWANYQWPPLDTSTINTTNNCLKLTGDGKWKQVDCNNETNYFICDLSEKINHYEKKIINFDEDLNKVKNTYKGFLDSNTAELDSNRKFWDNDKVKWDEDLNKDKKEWKTFRENDDKYVVNYEKNYKKNKLILDTELKDFIKDQTDFKSNVVKFMKPYAKSENIVKDLKNEFNAKHETVDFADIKQFSDNTFVIQKND